MKLFKTYRLSFLALLMMVLTYNLTASETDHDSIPCECNHYGYVYNSEGGACNAYILTDSGNVLFPVNMHKYNKIEDSTYVSFSYEIPLIDIACQGGEPIYLTCLEVLNTDSTCRVEISYTATKCRPEFSSKCEPNSYLFEGLSNENIVKWNWYINDSLMSSNSSFYHRFISSGEYTVRLISYNSKGCFATDSVLIKLPAQYNCYAAFRYQSINYRNSWCANGANCIIPEHLRGYQFIDYSRPIPVQWEWSINDSIFSNEQNPSLILEKDFDYEICLKTKTKDGCTANICQILIPDSLPECHSDFSYNPMRHLVDCAMDTDCIMPPSSIYMFNDMSTPSPVEWAWLVDGKIFSREQNPTYDFGQSGFYDVCLITSHKNGCYDSICKEIYVDIDTTPACKAYFNYCNYNQLTDSLSISHYSADSSIYLHEGYLVGFKNLSKPNVVRSHWSFGDGTFSVQKNPIHNYRKPGKYNVCLSINTSDTCWADYCTEVFVGVEECEVDIANNILVPDCAGYNIAYAFEAILDKEAYKYHWEFGDGEFSNEAAPYHIYDNPGIYPVTVDVTYIDGCTASKSITIHFMQDVVDTLFHEKCGNTPLSTITGIERFRVEKMYPMPVKDEMNINLTSNEYQLIDMYIIDALGRKSIMLHQYEINQGQNQLNMQLGEFSNGVYKYVINANNKILQGTIIIMK